MWDRIANIYHLGIIELLSVRYDHMPLVLIVYAFTYSVYEPATNATGELANASVAVVDEGHTEASRRIRDALRKPFVLPVGELKVEEIERAMDTGRFTFVIDVSPNFEADLERQRRAPIQLNVDATAMTQVTTGVRYIQYVIDQEITSLRGYQGAELVGSGRSVLRPPSYGSARP
jgi:ABC-2 type transport system permease protein